MRIGIIGGIERGWTMYQRMAEERGFRVEFHSGDVRGRGGATLETLVQRSDLVVVVTDINSHGAVHQARQLVRKYKRQLLIARNFGASRLAKVMDELEEHGAVAGALASVG